MTGAEWATQIASGLSVLLAGASLLYSLRRDASGDQRQILDRLARLETQMEVMWKDVVFAASHAAAATLHRHDDAFGLDVLIEKFVAETLAREEVPVFVARLEDVHASGPTERQRYAAGVLLRQVRERYGDA